MVYLSQICGGSMVNPRWMEKNMAQVPTYFPNEMYEKYGNLFEMGPYGSVGAHIKTGKRSMGMDPDHFQTPPDQKIAYKNAKNMSKILVGVALG